MELKTRIADIEKILEANIAKKDKVIEAFGALTGLELSSLDPTTKNRLEQNLVASNKVLRQYPIVTFDDYMLISDEHLDKLLTLIRKSYKCLRKFAAATSITT